MEHRVIGRNVPRKEGRAKVRGEALYVDDLTRPGMLHGATVRSTIARGRVTGISFGEGVRWDEFVVVTAKDIPGRNMVPMFLEDQPLLVPELGRVNHQEEPLLLLAHADRYQLARAVASVRVEYEEWPAVFDVEAAARAQPGGDGVIWGEDNVFKSFLLEQGDVEEAFAAADFVVEGVYRTGAQEQLYIETNGVIAEASAEAGVTVWGSLQCPFYVHRALKVAFGLPDEKVRVVQAETGGAFGGKEEYPSILCGHAALLAWKAGRPVKMIYDRAEDMAATTKRHPSRTRHRTAVSKDGMLLGAEIDFLIDGGAYATLSATVCSRGTIHAAGAYQWPALRVRSRAVATNTPPSGAFRGFGAPQALFALERHMDKVARVVGLAPEELRRRNFLKPGGTTATGQVVEEAVDMGALLDRALIESDYHAKTAEFARTNPGAAVKRGIGFAAFLHGAGFTGSGERYLNSLVGLEGVASGRVRVLVSSAEFGQGTNTILAQVAAEALGAEYEEIEVAQPDTAVVPNSGPTVASRTAMIVGGLVQKAAEGMLETLRMAGFLGAAHAPAELGPAVAAYVGQFGELKAFHRYEAPANVFWDDQHYKGEAYGSYAWAVYVAEVSVDTVTYQPVVTRFDALQEVGKVLHPVLAAGQIEGGVAQGIGYALYEKCVMREGRMVNNQMTNYIMPTSADVPPIHVHFEERPYAHGAYGAKGIGELPMDGPAPAILNAVECALGVGFDHVPLMPEDVMAGLI